MIDDVLRPLHQMMIIEPNPIPVKWALQYLGKIANGIRLPLTPLSFEHQDKMIEALQWLNAINRQYLSSSTEVNT